jgi:ferredoxin
MFKISVDKQLCIGCGACVAQCDNFEMTTADEPKAVAKKSEVEEIGCNQEAVDICPVQAIIIKKS